MNSAPGAPGILYGDWNSTDLMMQPAITGVVSAMNFVSVASCAITPSVMYAVCQDAAGFPLVVLQTQNNGNSWSAKGVTIVGAPPGKNITNALGSEPQGGDFKVLSVSPIDPKTVAFAASYCVISHDSGLTWNIMPGKGAWDAVPNYQPLETNYLHVDGHVVYFDPTDATGKRIYVRSDGGVSNSADGGTTFSTHANQKLATLLFQCEPELNLFG